MSPVRLPHTAYSQREQFYKDTLKLLDPGFLTQKVKVNGINIVFRSPSPSDYLLAEQTEDENKVWLCRFLSLCTWTIDHHVLTDINSSRRVFDCYQNLQPNILSCFFGVLRGLITRVKDSCDVVKIFSVEDPSRILWRQFDGKYQESIFGRSLHPHRELNTVQKLWVYYNSRKDEEDQLLREWSYVKSMLAPHLSKSSSNSWSSQEKERGKKQESENRVLKDEFYYKKIGVLEESGFKRPKRKSEVKDYGTLQDEFRRWVKGEMDDHDQTVKSYKDEIRKAWEERKAKREKQRQIVLEAHKQHMETLDPEKPLRLVGYSEEQLKEILQGKPKGSRIIDPEGSSYIYKGWVEQDPKPFKGSLQSQIEERSSKMKRGDPNV